MGLDTFGCGRGRLISGGEAGVGMDKPDVAFTFLREACYGKGARNDGNGYELRPTWSGPPGCWLVN